MQVMETRGTRVEQHDAFDALFFGHAARMVRLARLLGDDDPEDVVQESFCKLYAARGRLDRDERRVLAYLHRTVVNEVRSRHRHPWSYVATPTCSAPTMRTTRRAPTTTGPPSSRRSPPCRPGSGRRWCCATGWTCRWPRSQR